MFKTYLYNTLFHFQDKSGTISKVFLFGASPAFLADLRPSAYTDLTTMGVVGVAGITAHQVQVYLSVAVGAKSFLGINRLRNILCDILPGYVYAPDTPPQYPRRLLHTVLPALSSERLCAARDSLEITRACLPVATGLANRYTGLAVQTMYIRGKHLWQSHFDNLRVQRYVPMSPHSTRFRHRYHDFKADLSNGTSHTKTVFVPNRPDPFFAYCLDAGYLTLRFAEGKEDTDVFQYTFPGSAVYWAVGSSFRTQYLISDFPFFSFFEALSTLSITVALLFKTHLTVLRNGSSTLWIHISKILAAHFPMPTRLKTRSRVSGPA